MKASILRIEEGNTLETLRAFLRRLLESKIVDTLLVPKPPPSWSNVAFSFLLNVALTR